MKNAIFCCCLYFFSRRNKQIRRNQVLWDVPSTRHVKREIDNIVRDLIPDAVPGTSAEDVVSARVDYAKLDRLDSPVRARLSSTVVNARNLGDTGAFDKAEVTYFRSGEAYTVRTGACVLACWNMIIPVNQ